MTCERCGAVPAEPYFMDGRDGRGVLLCDACVSRAVLTEDDAHAYLRKRGLYEPGPGLSAKDMLTPAQCIEAADEAGV